MPDERSPNLRWSSGRVALATLVVAGVAAGFYLLYYFRFTFFLLFIAMVISISLRPAVEFLHRWGLNRAVGVLLLYTLLLMLVVGFFFLAIPLVVEQGSALLEQLPDYYNTLRTGLIRSTSVILRRIGFRLPSQLNLDTMEGTWGSPALPAPLASLNYVALVLRTVLALVAIFILGFYWTLESRRIIHALLLLIPTERRENVRALVNDAQQRVGKFIRAQTILCIIIGALALIAYLIIGLPYALTLAIIAGILEAVPMIGPTLGAVPAVLVAISISPLTALWVVIATILIQALENNLIVPKVMDEAMGIHPMLTLLALATFGSLLGLPGALLAIPIAALLQLLMNRVVVEPRSQETVPVSRDSIGRLRYEAQNLAQDVRKQLERKPEASSEEEDRLEDAVEEVAQDLDALLAQLDDQGVTWAQ
ncbi:MAG: AI-2E family transporter [Anaerolineales bacterium]